MHDDYIMDKLPPEVLADYLDRIHRFVLMDDTFMAKGNTAQRLCVDCAVKSAYKVLLIHFEDGLISIFRQLVQ